MRSLKTLAWTLAMFALAAPFLSPRTVESQTVGLTEAPSGFDNVTNGCVSQYIHDRDRAVFEDIEDVADGIGPTFNGDSCAGCHSMPVSGGVSSITELRAGHWDRRGNFVPATAYV